MASHAIASQKILFSPLLKAGIFLPQGLAHLVMLGCKPVCVNPQLVAFQALASLLLTGKGKTFWASMDDNRRWAPWSPLPYSQASGRSLLGL
jgi:hypothetical protein